MTGLGALPRRNQVAVHEALMSEMLLNYQDENKLTDAEMLSMLAGLMKNIAGYQVVRQWKRRFPADYKG